jgi:hypothetical protein
MSVYEERDAIRIIVLVSDDSGVTWYPRGGDPAHASEERDNDRIIKLRSADAGVTWTTT